MIHGFQHPWELDPETYNLYSNPHDFFADGQCASGANKSSWLCAGQMIVVLITTSLIFWAVAWGLNVEYVAHVSLFLVVV